MLRKSLIALVVLAGIVSLLVYPDVYVTRGSISGGTLYWNAQQALVFIEASTSGARVSHIRYALDPFLAGVVGVRQPDDKRCSESVVVQVTDKGIQRFDTDLYRYAEDPYCGMNFAAFEGQIYAGYLAEDRLWRWSGTHFDPATAEEVRAFDAAKIGAKVDPHPWQFDNVDGWSMRAFGQTPPKYELVLNGQPLTILFSGETWPPKPLSVDLVRAGQPPQRIWEFDGRPHRVSKAEYEHTFQKQR
ncbi:MAG TPA: hypothetical protein VJO53_04965 [Candidatus Acidoferrales bacterium]|nr:hypothetical protein [Candidatus Acidoferrales bacterium]